MNIEISEIKYKNDMPFEAELHNIQKQFPHRHSTELELVYCLEGSIHLIAADQDYIISAGQIHSIDFWDIHYLESNEKNVTLIFHLDLSALPKWDYLKYIFFACESNHCYPYQNPAMEQVKDIVLSLSNVYLNNTILTVEEKNSAVDKLSSILLQYFNWFNYNNQDEYMNQSLFDRFTRVLAYIQENYKRKITVSQLAAQEHVNKNYFSQFISKTVFNSFSTMVKYIRCYEAETLLLTTDMSISDISFDCGFSDPKYFYSAFKELWRTTPREHRRKYARQCELASISETGIPFEEKEAVMIVDRYIIKWHLKKVFACDY